MAFRGRHRVYALFWPWGYDPFIASSDVSRVQVSKNVGSGQTARLNLFPCRVPTSSGGRDPSRGYRDILHPNDWLFLFTDPNDGGDPEPLFLGFIDRVTGTKSVDQAGMISRSVEVSATGWEKAVLHTQALASPYIASEINLATLVALGPAGQVPNTETLPGESPTSGVSQFQDHVHNVISWLVETFLSAGQNTDSTSGIRSELAQLEGTENTEQDQARPLMGQFEIPGTNTPLWNFLRMRFQNVQQRTFVSSTMFLRQVNTTLAQMIDAISNQPINEIIYDVRRVSRDGLSDIRNELVPNITGGYSRDSVQRFIDAASRADTTIERLVNDIAPFMIFRERPLFASEIEALDGPVLNESEFTGIDLGASDVDLHNLTILETPGVSANSPARISSGFPGLERYRAETLESIRRHGLRFYQDNVAAWPAQYTAPHPTPELVRDWDIRLHRAGLDNVSNWSGSAVLPKFVRDLYLGGKLGIVPFRPTGTGSDDARVYQVDSIDYSYEASTGAFTTSIGLVRGQISNMLNSEYRSR